MRLTFTDFWANYDESDTFPFNALFKMIFEGTNTQLHFYSVFGTTKPPPHADDCITVSYSGEPYARDPDEFDVSLIMQPNDESQRIVGFPLFVIDSYYYDYWSMYRTTRPLKPKDRFCAFIISNAGCATRNKMFHMLTQYKHVDSCGGALNNCGGFCAPRGRLEYLNFLQRFKFMICFENCSKPFYLTEKFYYAWVGGTIPIYWGCPNIVEWLNPKAFLYLKDDSDEAMIELIQKVIELDNDHAKYMEMYNQPLLIGEIPDDLNLDAIRKRVATILKHRQAEHHSGYVHHTV